MVKVHVKTEYTSRSNSVRHAILRGSVRGYFRRSIKMFDALESDNETAEVLIKAAKLVAHALATGHCVHLMGNGGSAADAQHIAAEFVGRFIENRPALRAHALTTDTSILTAVANDYGYGEVFSRQIEGLVKRGDVVIGFSTSGSSPNVLRGFEAANRLGATTIGFCGQHHELFSDSCDVVIEAPELASAHIQDAHITLAHILCVLVEKMLIFPGNE